PPGLRGAGVRRRAPGVRGPPPAPGRRGAAPRRLQRAEPRLPARRQDAPARRRRRRGRACRAAERACPRRRARRGEAASGARRPQHPGGEARSGARHQLLERHPPDDPLALYGSPEMTAPRARLTGTAFGLGVGPGDPELVTLKALRLLRAAPVVAYPAPEDGESFARAIVAEQLRPGQRE